MAQRTRPRAQRFSIQMPMQYRPLGEHQWRQALTANISRSGVLFRAEDQIDPETELEMKMVLPATIAGQAAGNVICRGQVVRTLPADPFNPNPAMAATIGSFRLAPRWEGGE